MHTLTDQQTGYTLTALQPTFGLGTVPYLISLSGFKVDI